MKVSELDEEVDMEVEFPSTSGGSNNNYDNLINLPKLNGVTLRGNKSLEEVGAQPEGDYLVPDNIVRENVDIDFSKYFV